MSLLMDALRRAEAEKKQQEARAARAAPTPAPPGNDSPTRVSPAARPDDLTQQFDSRALAERIAAQAELELEADGGAAPGLAAAAPLALEPMHAERTFNDVTLAADDDDTGDGTNLGLPARPGQTSTLPSSRGRDNDL